MKRSTRRTALGWLAATPGALLVGCGDQPTTAPVFPSTDSGSSTPDASGEDAAVADAGETITCAPTNEDALGPFYEGGAPVRQQIASSEEPGERLIVEGRLLDVRDCRAALSNHTIDLWQATAGGEYVDAGPDYRLRGRIVTGSDGSFSFESIIPGHYRIASGERPAHIHIRVFDPEGSSILVSQLYFEGDPFLGAADACQPPTCFSNDANRVLSPTTTMIAGRPGKMAMLPLFV